MDISLKIKILQSSFKTSLFVGTTLSFINQFQYIMTFSLGKNEIIKILFNYLIPFSVSAYSRFSTLNEIRNKEINNE